MVTVYRNGEFYDDDELLEKSYEFHSFEFFYDTDEEEVVEAINLSDRAILYEKMRRIIKITKEFSLGYDADGESDFIFDGALKFEMFTKDGSLVDITDAVEVACSHSYEFYEELARDKIKEYY